MNTSNITTYKPKDFAELPGVSVKTLQCWDREGTKGGGEEIAKELQDRNQSNTGTESKNK